MLLNHALFGDSKQLAAYAGQSTESRKNHRQETPNSLCVRVMCGNEEEEDDNVADDCVEDENVEDDEKDHNVAEDEVDDDDVAEDEVEDDDVEDDEKDHNFAEDEVEDDDVEDEDVEGRTDPKTATTVLCEPAQSKCT